MQCASTNCNLLMGAEVCGLLPALPQAYLRCAGSLGRGAFEEAHGHQLVPVCAELSARDIAVFGLFDTPMFAPVNILSNECSRGGVGIISLHTRAILRWGQIGVLSSDAWRRSQWRRISIHWEDLRGYILTDYFMRMVTVSEIEFSGYGLKMVPFGFLSNVSAERVALSGLCDAVNVGSRFMNLCVYVQHLDLSPLRNVTIVGDYFLQSCTELRDLDLTPMQSIVSIGVGFLAGCSSLTSIDLSALRRLTNIPVKFLHSCRSIREIDCCALSCVRVIGDSFLERCAALHSVNLSSFGSVLSVGNHFMSKCNSLLEVDLSRLASLGSVGTYFLSGTGIATIDLGVFKEFEQLPAGFLEGCSSLTHVDLAPLSNVTQVGSRFLANCDVLGNIDLRPLANVTEVGDGFLRGCVRLRGLDIAPVQHVVSKRQLRETIPKALKSDCAIV